MRCNVDWASKGISGLVWEHCGLWKARWDPVNNCKHLNLIMLFADIHPHPYLPRELSFTIRSPLRPASTPSYRTPYLRSWLRSSTTYLTLLSCTNLAAFSIADFGLSYISHCSVVKVDLETFHSFSSPSLRAQRGQHNDDHGSERAS